MVRSHNGVLTLNPIRCYECGVNNCSHMVASRAQPPYNTPFDVKEGLDNALKKVDLLRQERDELDRAINQLEEEYKEVVDKMFFSCCKLGEERDEALGTIKSLSRMLGWSNVPPRKALERDLLALKVRVSRSEDALLERGDFIARVRQLEAALLSIADQDCEKFKSHEAGVKYMQELARKVLRTPPDNKKPK